MSFKLLFTIVFVSLLAAASLLGYRLFYQDPVISDAVANDGSGVTSQNLLETGADGQITSEAVEVAEYSRLLRVIEGISSIDNSIFTNNAFKTLFNFNFPIPTPVPHRNNPFAPVGAP